MNAVVESNPSPQQLPAMPTELTPSQMLALAVSQGADLARIEKLMDLKDRWEERQARQAFVEAMAAFKADPVRIIKSKRADIPGGAKYSYATLADVYDGALTELSRHGLSHRYELKQDDTGRITVTCVLTHIGGHSERVSLSAMPDDSGKKNNVQQIASTVHYLERYTFLAATGLASKEIDNDARTAAKAPEVEPPPEGYANWRADMSAMAEEGSDRLTAAWKESENELRRYVVKFDEKWWLETKAKAAKAIP